MRKCAVILSLAVLLVACGRVDSTPKNADANDEPSSRDPGRRWEALHKVGNWWSVLYFDQTYRYEVVSVIGSKAIVSRVTLSTWQVMTGRIWDGKDKRVIEVRKPDYADDMWRPEDGAREIARGVGMVGGMNCYWVEYEVIPPDIESGATPDVHKVWRMDSCGVAIKATRNGEEVMIISERELK